MLRLAKIIILLYTTHARTYTHTHIRTHHLLLVTITANPKFIVGKQPIIRRTSIGNSFTFTSQLKKKKRLRTPDVSISSRTPRERGRGHFDALETVLGASQNYKVDSSIITQYLNYPATTAKHRMISAL
jgi:hypothetical protein